METSLSKQKEGITLTYLERFDRAAARFAPDKALLGVDPGKKTIGLAYAPPPWTGAVALDPIKRRPHSDVLAAIARIHAAYDADGMIIGLPLQMDGKTGPAAHAALGFAHRLARRLNAPCAMWDERYSTRAMQRVSGNLREAQGGFSIDSLAALYILQGALARLSTLRQT